MAERIFDNVKITSSFEIPEARENLVSGETLGKLFGKIAKVIDDLDPSAFEGFPVYQNTTAEWDKQKSLIAENGVIYVYTDYSFTGSDGNTCVVPNIKIGDGKAYLIDTPFITTITSELLAIHENDTMKHITNEERLKWNNIASSSDFGMVKTTSAVTNTTGFTACPIVEGVPYYYDHTYSIMTAATESANGKYGLVPSPAAGKQNSFLRGDGTWADVTASDCLPLAGGTMTGTIKSNAQYPLIVNDGDSKAYGFPLRVNKSDGTAMCNIATQHTDALNALLFQIYEPSDTSKYAYFNIYADPSTGYRMATNCTMPKNYTAGTVLYGNKATTVTLNYKPSAVLLYCEAVNTGGWAVMGLNASHLTSTGFTIPAGEADNSSVYCFALKGGSYSPFLGSTVHYVAFK